MKMGWHHIAEEGLKKQYELTKAYEHIFISSHKKQFYSHDIIGVNFQRILKKTGIKARVLYNLRHTFASQLISKGADIVWVSKMLSHKDVSITLKIYTKFIEENDEIRFKKIEKMGTLIWAHSMMRASKVPSLWGLESENKGLLRGYRYRGYCLPF